MWVVELRQRSAQRGGRAASVVKRWATLSRVEAEMVAAAELVQRGVSADNAALFTSMAGRSPVHADCSKVVSSFQLSLRIYQPIWKKRWRRYDVVSALVIATE